MGREANIISFHQQLEFDILQVVNTYTIDNAGKNDEFLGCFIS